MHAARIALRRTPAAATLLRAAAIRMTANRTALSLNRHLSSPAAAASQKLEPSMCIRKENVDFVREAIGRMMNSKEESDLKPIADEELENSLNSFAHLFDEARACISDCEESKADLVSFAEEYETAQSAVDNVFSCYIDLLDDFRRASDEQLKTLCQDRLSLAHRLKSLRQELRKLTESESK